VIGQIPRCLRRARIRAAATAHFQTGLRGPPDGERYGLPAPAQRCCGKLGTRGDDLRPVARGRSEARCSRQEGISAWKSAQVRMAPACSDNGPGAVRREAGPNPVHSRAHGGGVDRFVTDLGNGPVQEGVRCLLIRCSYLSPKKRRMSWLHTGAAAVQADRDIGDRKCRAGGRSPGVVVLEIAQHEDLGGLGREPGDGLAQQSRSSFASWPWSGRRRESVAAAASSSGRLQGAAAGSHNVESRVDGGPLKVPLEMRGRGRRPAWRKSLRKDRLQHVSASLALPVMRYAARNTRPW